MKESLTLVMKGFVVGLGKVIPGVSGAVLAILLKVYQPALNAVVNLKKNLYQNLKYLATLGLGLILAITLGSKILLFFLEKFPMQSLFLFIGMMINGIISVFHKANKGTTQDKIVSVVILLFFFCFSFLKFDNDVLSRSFFFNFFLYFLSGILDAAASIIPGISGTVILMMLGTYHDVLGSLGSVFSVSLLLTNLKILLPFFCGMLCGLFLFSKLIHYLFKKHYYLTYNCIVGLCLLSIFSLVETSLKYYVNLSQLIISVVFMLCGYFITKKLNIS